MAITQHDHSGHLSAGLRTTSNWENSGVPAPDLNQLVVLKFAWVFDDTGIQSYKDRAVQAFQSGVEKWWQGGMKQFNQNYRKSYETAYYLTR